MSISFNPAITKPAFSSPKMLPTSLSTTGPLTLSVPTENNRSQIDSISSNQTSGPFCPILPPGPWPYPPGHFPNSLFNNPPAHSGYPENLTSSALPHFQAPVGGNALMENLENWRQFQQAAYANNLDPHLLAFYHSNGCAMDLTNAPRRKNATRETTSMLKAWLNEHRKNPYPTKGEKIMLAIITKMTLTQVSTWFANARRRLKKENKMTWSPRNRSEEDRGDAERHSNDDHDSCKDDDEEDRESSGSLNVDGDDENDLDDLENYTMASLIEKNKNFLLNKNNSSDVKPNYERNDSRKRPTSNDVQNEFDRAKGGEKKAKIWSLVDLATKPELTSPTLPKLSPQCSTVNNSQGVESSSLNASMSSSFSSPLSGEITSSTNMGLPINFMESHSAMLSKLLPTSGGLLPPGMTSLPTPPGILNAGHHLPYPPALFNLPPNPFFFGGGLVAGLHPMLKHMPKLGHQEFLSDSSHLTHVLMPDSSSKS